MTNELSISVRTLTSADEPFLWKMLYQALYALQGDEPFPPDIERQMEISKYAQGWGNPGDIGLIAIDEANQQSVGAAWIRLLTGENKGYGYVDDATPELSIAVAPEYRGRGVGTQLLFLLLAKVRSQYGAVSLSVSSDNPAVRFYQRLGFEVIATDCHSLTMAKRLNVWP
jgi:ribosomal protein S18 acetylase RimI-like enzyme